MKKILCILTLCAMLVAGCSQAEQPQVLPTTEPQQKEAQQTEPQQTEQNQSPMTDMERMAAAAEWLNKDFSFILDFQFNNPGVCSMMQRTEYLFGKDGTRGMVNVRRLQYPGEEAKGEMGRFFYRYEGSEYICYTSIDDQAPQRIPVSGQTLIAMEADKAILVGELCLMPSYLEGLYVTNPVGVDEVTALAYWLPVDQVLADKTMISVYLNNAFALSGKTYPNDANAGILMILEIDTATCRPITLSCIFNEVRPYVIPESVLTGQVEEDQKLMYMEYSFYYDLAESVTVPEDMIP